jgi:hypothetical protein
MRLPLTHYPFNQFHHKPPNATSVYLCYNRPTYRNFTELTYSNIGHWGATSRSFDSRSNSGDSAKLEWAEQATSINWLFRTLKRNTLMLNVYVDGGETMFLNCGRATTSLLFIHHKIMSMDSRGGMILTEETLSTRRKASATMSTTNTTWTDGALTRASALDRPKPWHGLHTPGFNQVLRPSNSSVGCRRLPSAQAPVVEVPCGFSGGQSDNGRFLS